MMNERERIISEIDAKYGENSQYILNDYEISGCIEGIERYEKQGKKDIAKFVYEELLENAENFNNNRLSPVTVEVGDGVTVNLWSDRHAGTVIKKTKCSITIQYDTAILNPDFKPEFEIGGFAAHCTNQGEQSYTYERNPDGRIETYRWSNKRNRYQGGGDGSITVSKGRHEFYDYNF